MFGRGLAREKAESAWVDGVDYCSKMKGCRGIGKLDTYFGSAAHASALHFFENERIKNREVVEIFINIVLALTRNGLALRGSESSDNYDDGNF